MGIGAFGGTGSGGVFGFIGCGGVIGAGVWSDGSCLLGVGGGVKVIGVGGGARGGVRGVGGGVGGGDSGGVGV